MTRLFYIFTIVLLSSNQAFAAVIDKYDGLFMSGSPVINELKREGLSTTSSLTFAKDHYGRLWMGGRYGISWFDGFEYHKIKVGETTVGGQAPIYKIVSAGKMGMWYLNHRKSVSFYSFLEKKEYTDITIGKFHVEDIVSASSGRLMLATDSGIHTLQYSLAGFELSEFLSSAETAMYLYVKRDDLYYATENQIYRVQNFKSDKKKESIGFNGKINSKFVVDDKGVIWFSSEGDLLSYKDGAVDARISSAGATDMMLGSNGQLWVGTRGRGLWVIDVNSAKVSRVYDINSVHGLALGADTINAIYEDDSGVIWIGRFSKSAAYINPGYDAFSNIVNNPWKDKQILDNSIFYILKHSSGNIWVGHSRKGISILDNNGQVIGYVRTSAQTDVESSVKPSILAGLPAGSVYAMVENDKGDVYVSVGDKGIFTVSSDFKSVELLSESGTNIGRKFFNLVIASNQTLYASGNEGVFFYDRDAGAYESVRVTGIENYSSRTNHSFTDKDANLWFAGKDYVGVIPAGEKTFDALSNTGHIRNFSKDTGIRYVFRSTKNHAFVAVGNELFSANFNKINSTIDFDLIPIKGGVSTRFYEDEDGKIWSSHETGDTVSGEYEKFSRADGLLPFVDRYFAQEKLSSNIQVHGSSEGLVVIRKDRIRPWTFNAPIVVSQVSLDGAIQDINAGPVVVLPEHNSVEIVVAALDYSDPKSNLYAYRMAGYQNEWLESDYQGRRITLNNLDPGDYQLEIKGSNRKGAWGDQPKILTLSVLPHWYETYWFKAIMLIMFCAFIWGLYRLRVRHLKIRQLQLENTVATRTDELKYSLEVLENTKDQLVESEKQASLGRLVRGVSHELNTPIGVLKSSNSGLYDIALSTRESFVGGQLTPESLKRVLDSAVSSTDLMAKNIERMALLTGRFKQSSAEEVASEFSLFNVKKVLHVTTLDFKETMGRIGVQLLLDCDDGIDVFSSPMVLRNIIFEILDNSLFHAFEGYEEGSEQATITIKVRQHRGAGIIIVVADNGRGMDEATRLEVFEPFFTRSQESEKIGLGMHSAINWVTQILQGTIHCRSELGKGTVFILKLKGTQK